MGKRKRVSFGGHLSPELFDKSLPPNSPLKRGALPARQSLPYGNSPQAVLKKAQGLKHLTNQVNVRSNQTAEFITVIRIYEFYYICIYSIIC